MSENVQAKQAEADAAQTEAVAKVEPVPAAPATPARSRKAAPKVAAPVKKAAAETVMAVAPKRAARKPAAPKPAAAPKAPVKAEPAKAEAVATKPAGKAGKAKKVVPPKVKLVRDSFTIPETDYALFASLKQRALSAGVEIKKSELLRAALALLAATNDVQFIKVVGGVERIKTGRPKK